jgi:hypothetical protein
MVQAKQQITSLVVVVNGGNKDDFWDGWDPRAVVDILTGQKLFPRIVRGSRGSYLSATLTVEPTSRTCTAADAVLSAHGDHIFEPDHCRGRQVWTEEPASEAASPEEREKDIFIRYRGSL